MEMPVWTWIVIVAVIVIAIVAVVVASSASRRKRSERLKSDFGPEYERTVAETGEQKAAEKELIARERKRHKLDIHPLSNEALNEYTTRWGMVQTAFVDNPSSAVGEADRLVSEVMHARGYPVEDFEEQAANVSVDHPSVVENYRAAHGIHLAQQNVEVGTEDLRNAFVHYRKLFEKLLETSEKTTTSQEATA
jgi:FtsZ-interacting cell division protein ZipA